MHVKEGTNSAIAFNSAVLYARLGITAICGLFTTRFALKALGFDDFGLFALLGSIITLIDVVNTIMVRTTTRFLTVAIGKGDQAEINRQFNVNLTIHITVALVTLLIAFPIGFWYIHSFLNYTGNVGNAHMVFSFTLVGSIITFIGVPYDGLMRAKENFLAISIPGIVAAIIKLFIAVVLVYFFTHKLFIYALGISILTAYPTLYYIWYCHRNYHNYTKINRCSDRSCYKEVIKFSGWVGYGTAAQIVKGQGAAILINTFFTTAMNAAIGVANTVNGFVMNFAQNASQPMLPQITKSYAAGNKERCNELLCMTTKFSFLLILLISSPFLIDAHWLMELLLGKLPEYAPYFAILIIIDNLVNSFNHGIETLIFASGKIAVYQFLSNTLRLLALVAAYFILKSGASQFSLYYTYISCTAIIIITNQIIINRVLNYDNMVLIKGSYIPSLSVVFLFLPYLFLSFPIHPSLSILIGVCYLCLIIYFVGLNNSEKKYLRKLINSYKKDVSA